MAELIGNVFTPPGSEQHQNDNLSWCNKILMLNTVSATQISWYTPSGSAQPARIRLWRVSDGAILIDQAITGSPSGTGWHTNTFTAVTLTAGVQYVVGVSTVAADARNWFITFWNSSAPPVDQNFQQVGVVFGVGTAGAAIPTFTSSSLLAGVSIGDGTGYVSGGTPTSGSGATTTEVNNLLDSWLVNTTENSHKTDGLPWETNERTKTIANVVGSTSGQLDATKAVSDAIHDLLTATNKNLGTLWDLAGHLADLEIAAWQHFFGAGETRLTGPNSAGGSAFYTADGQLVSQLVAEIWQRTLVLRNDLPFGVAPWHMSADSDFEDAIAFAEPADAYVLNIISYQDTQPANSSPAGLWLPRLGWWCVLTGTLASQRQFVDFQEQLLTSNGQRMAGCAIQLRPGTLANVQAWLLA